MKLAAPRIQCSHYSHFTFKTQQITLAEDTDKIRTKIF